MMTKQTVGTVAVLACASICAQDLPNVIGGPYPSDVTDSTYYLLEGSTWHAAQATAKAMGGHLVVINDAAEQRWIEGTFDLSNNYWIGLTDEVNEGVWRWVNGDPFDYSNWYGGMPDNEAVWDPAEEDSHTSPKPSAPASGTTYQRCHPSSPVMTCSPWPRSWRSRGGPAAAD